MGKEYLSWGNIQTQLLGACIQASIATFKICKKIKF